MAKLTAETFKQNLWPLANGSLAFVFAGLLVALFSSGGNLATRAMDEGRRIVIHLTTSEILGNPATLPEPVKAEPATDSAAPDDELPPVAVDVEQPQQMNNAMPGNFVGEKLESHGPSLPADTEAPTPAAAEPEKAYHYPEAVKQEPQTRRTATAAPAATVKVRELEAAPSGQPLSSAPVADLVEEVSDDIKLPKIGSDGKRPWQVYGKPFDASSSEPLVAVIVAGLGMNNATQIAFGLQENFTLSLSPYGKEVAMWGNQARLASHEVLIDLPMQTQDYPATDPGPKGLLTTLKPDENLERLHWVMSRFPGYVGVLTSPGAAIPPAVIQNCLSDIAARGLLMVELPMATEMQPGGAQKSQMGLLSLSASHLLDGEMEEEQIQLQLAELVTKAKKEGQAIGIARPYPLTLQVLQQWQKTLEKQGVRLAPVSALAARVKE